MGICALLLFIISCDSEADRLKKEKARVDTERARIQREIDTIVDSIIIINDVINALPHRTVGGEMESNEEYYQYIAAIKANKLDSLAFGENYHKVDSLRSIIKSYRPRTDSLRRILKELPRYE